MVRLYLFAEGQTEQTFADNILKLYLAQHSVFMDKIMLIAHARKKGHVHRGGGRKYKPMKDDIVRFLNQEKGSKVFFTTMIDLYAIAPDFPGLAEAESLRQNPVQRVEFLEQRFAEDIGDYRFIPYIQLHEYEAYLFADPTCFKYLDALRTREIEALQVIANQYETPELINDGQQTAPSKRIIAQFPDYGKAKSAFGPQLAEQIGLEVIRSRCPHFNTWLLQLESLNNYRNNSAEIV
ncbi:hypothetical protein A4S05_04565 [Nostoc sp. KVJ20]|uniref:DUF4276 family protein n=1 Tax=unclassified Nostoc TaxID=2593658 RepID=UPI00083E41CB|nr:DUF4276 family protein [Nostoc sp. KVJ20]ODG99529.1 hypothetical protein A4S05_04565 [Nostoc sp. KVJ20]